MTLRRSDALPLLAAVLAVCPLPLASPSAADELDHTYSVVARDPTTGEIGVAVQTHAFAVGRRVPWAEAGVGAVATQSFTNPAFGPDGLALLRQGKTAQETLDALIAGDEGRDVRQVAIVDAAGRVAAWTGERCIPAAGHRTGDGFSVQANMMRDDGVWPAMARAYAAATAMPLAERLLWTLEVAEGAGGDIRGRQSAALVVVRPEASGRPWEDRVVDLRVDDHAAPLAELRRLLHRQRAYERRGAATAALEAGDLETAQREIEAAAAMLPDDLELRFWWAVGLAGAGRVEASLPYFRWVFERDPSWRELTRRLPGVGRLEVSDEDLARILGGA